MQRNLFQVLILIMIALLGACSKPDPEAIKQGMNGVWRSERDGGLLTLVLQNRKVSLALTDATLSAKFDSIDAGSQSVNLSINQKETGTVVWTLQQVGDKDKPALLLTREDGSQDKLQFVRKIGPADQNRLANLKLKEKREAGKPTPSFDCTRAQNQVEEMICSDRELARADVELNRLYKAAIKSTANQEQMAEVQAAWREQERDQCADIACVNQAYQARIAQLTHY